MGYRPQNLVQEIVVRADRIYLIYQQDHQDRLLILRSTRLSEIRNSDDLRDHWPEASWSISAKRYRPLEYHLRHDDHPRLTLYDRHVRGLLNDLDGLPR